jgi:hypothetical protein
MRYGSLPTSMLLQQRIKGRLSDLSFLRCCNAGSENMCDTARAGDSAANVMISLSRCLHLVSDYCFNAPCCVAVLLYC